MSRTHSAITFSLVALLAAVSSSAQGIRSDASIETGGQLVSSAPQGTPPLQVWSSTRIPQLNADFIDGIEGSALALDADLQNVETLLAALQDQFDAQGVARLRRTGQATCYAEGGAVVACGTGVSEGQDGALQLGVNWPSPRFTNNGDGTVTDHLTGLVWLQDANCDRGRLDWVEALTFAKTLFDGSSDHNGGDCGLSDGSLSGEWRLPNPIELQSLFHYGISFPAIPNTAGTGQWSEGDPFTNVKDDFYWTSGSFHDSPGIGWLCNLSYGSVRYGSKLGSWRAWPVRGGR